MGSLLEKVQPWQAKHVCYIQLNMEDRLLDTIDQGDKVIYHQIRGKDLAFFLVGAVSVG